MTLCCFLTFYEPEKSCQFSFSYALESYLFESESFSRVSSGLQQAS